MLANHPPQGVSALLKLLVPFWSGGHFFGVAWAALKQRSANMNTLIALGTAAAWLYSTIAILFPSIFPKGIKEIHVNTHVTILMVTHTTQLASYGTRALEIANGVLRSPDL